MINCVSNARNAIKSIAPSEEYTIFTILMLPEGTKMAANKPNRNNEIHAINNAPLHTVISYFVCDANIMIAKLQIIVIPKASITISVS